MGKLRLFIAIIVAAMALALIPAVVSAQGVTTFYGNVTIDGQRAPSGTTVVVTQADGTELRRGTTGERSLNVDQYRIEIQATPGLDGQTVNIGVPETSQAIQATAVFETNRATKVDVAALTIAPTPTPTPTPTATPVPTSTPTPVATATPIPFPTPLPTATPQPIPNAIQGPRGPAGATGLAGPQGPVGAQGIQGPRGEQGERGVAGSTGADGPAGPVGSSGDAGSSGPQGSIGPAGPASESSSIGWVLVIVALAIGALGLVAAVVAIYRGREHY